MPTNRACRLVIEVASHALDTETMATWKKTRFYHEVEAQATVSFNRFLLFVVQNIDYIPNFILKLLKLLVELLLRDLGIILGVVAESFFGLLSLHVSILVGLHGIWFPVFIEVHHFVLDPVSILFIESPPFSQDLRLLHFAIFLLKFLS